MRGRQRIVCTNLALILLLPIMAIAQPDTLDHNDSIYECALSINPSGCCGSEPTENCNYVNLGADGMFYIGRVGAATNTIYTSLFGIHLGGRTKTNLDSVIVDVRVYIDLDGDSTLELRCNPLLKAIVTVTDTLEWRYGHYSAQDYCWVDICDSSPTGAFQIRDTCDNVKVLWTSTQATRKNTDFDGNIEDSITINGTGHKRIPITNCVKAAMDSGYTYCDMIWRDKETYVSVSPFHSIGGKVYGYMSFTSRQYDYLDYQPIVIFYYSEEEEVPSRRRQILLDQ